MGRHFQGYLRDNPGMQLLLIETGLQSLADIFKTLCPDFS
jgi:hypothetical protein